jgi:hypothetical protein
LTIGDPPVELVVIEDLNFAGMGKNEAAADAVGDGG